MSLSSCIHQNASLGTRDFYRQGPLSWGIPRKENGDQAVKKQNGMHHRGLDVVACGAITILIISSLFLMSCSRSKGIQEYETTLLNITKHHEHLYAISGVEGKELWAVGAAGTILYSSDGGSNWELQECGVAANLYDVYFENEKTGWAAGENGAILETTNGGKAWNVLQKDKEYNIFSLGHTDDSLWAVGSGGKILRKKKTKTTWEEKSLEGEPDTILNKIIFTNNERGFVCGEFGVLFETRDGGENWSKLEISQEEIQNKEDQPFIYGVNFINEQEGVITQPGYKVLFTKDGGQSWKMVVRDRNYYDACYSENTWYFLGEGGITTFRKDSNVFEVPEFFSKPQDVSVWVRGGLFSGGKGYFVGKNGAIFVVSDGTWNKVHPS